MSIPTILSDSFWRTALFDEAPVAILVCRDDGLVHACNLALAALVGYTTAEVEGGSFFSFFHAAEQPAIRRGIASLGAGASFDICARLAHRSGSYHYARLHIARGDDTRLVCHVILLVSDGTVAVRTPEGVADQIFTVRPRMTLLELVMVNPAMSAVVGVVLLVLIGREKLVEIIKLWLAH